MSSPKISIIVPVYKVEKYLRQCLDSIVAQTFTDWECILIDDGSPDASGNICDEYDEMDCRIVVLHKKNEGVSLARNDGMKVAKGEYIVFIDADDWIDKDYIENLLLNKDFALVVAGYREYGVSQIEKGPQESKKVSVVQDIPKIWADPSNSYWWFVWGKLFKKEVITKNHLLFKSGMIYLEDFCFVLEYLAYIDFVFLDASCKIHHLVEQTKYSKYKMNYGEFKKHLGIHSECLKILERKCNCVFETMRERISFRHFYNFLLYLMFSSNSFKDRLRDVCQYISEKNNEIFIHVKVFGPRANVYWMFWRFCAAFFKPFVKYK